MKPEYFPLIPGTSLLYSLRRTGASGSLRLEVLSARRQGRSTVARGRRVTLWEGSAPLIDTVDLISGPGGARAGGSVEFKGPVAVGTRWFDGADECWIDGFDGTARTPAGLFTGCLRVAYLIAGGDGGSGERLYAPGIGLVRVEHRDESDPYVWELTERAGPRGAGKRSLTSLRRAVILRTCPESRFIPAASTRSRAATSTSSSARPSSSTT